MRGGAVPPTTRLGDEGWLSWHGVDVTVIGREISTVRVVVDEIGEVGFGVPANATFGA